MKAGFFVGLLFMTLQGLSQNTDSLWLKKNYTKKEIYITMRDGVRLFTSVYSPVDSLEKHPVLITRTPYSCAPYGADKMKKWYENHYKEYLKEKYILVIQDVRGRFMSEGTFADIRPFNPGKKDKETDEASDTYDTIDWLIKNLRHNNGNVGVFGISYPGFYSTMAALCNHPALKAVSPQAPVTDWFIGDDFHHNGAFMLMDAFSFYSTFGRPRPKPVTEWPNDISYFTKDNYDFYLKYGNIQNLTNNFMGDSIVFWNDLMNHPNQDDWWKNRTVTNFINTIQPATLVVGGLFDAEDCYGAWKTYATIEQKNAAKNNNRLVMGPWSHGGWAKSDGSKLGNVQFGSKTSEWYQKNIEIPFFNYYLKVKGRITNMAEATIFFTGENKWRLLPQWPPAKTQLRELYFHKEKELRWETPVQAAGSEKPKDADMFTEYISDPSTPVPYAQAIHHERTKEYMTDDQRFASRRPDVLTFETQVLHNDVTVAGPVLADIMVSITGTDADFVVKLIDVFPDNFQYSDTDKYIMNGYQMLVRGEVIRGKYRNSFEKPEAFVPKKITNVQLALPDVAHTFKKGHKIMVQVQSSWFPLVDRNPQKYTDIYHARLEDFQKIAIKLYHGQGINSKIILPVME